MLINLLWIILGFAVLIFSADILVNGSSGLAKRLNLSDLMIGMTVVAFGTSAPELVVNLKAGLSPDTTDLALSNIIGSNMINTFVILGIAALIYPLASKRSSRAVDIPLSFAAPVIVYLMMLDGTLTSSDGIILIVLFLAFIIYNTWHARKHPDEIDELEHYKPMPYWKAILLILAGLSGLVGGAELIVPNATNIAEAMGVSQSVIGLTIVALGTSLPELATSAVSAYKKNSDIAIGNILGSNIFNVFLILGATGTLQNLPEYPGLKFDLGFAALGSLLVFIFIKSNKKRIFTRWAGGIVLLIYIVYLTWTLINS